MVFRKIIFAKIKGPRGKSQPSASGDQKPAGRPGGHPPTGGTHQLLHPTISVFTRPIHGLLNKSSFYSTNAVSTGQVQFFTQQIQCLLRKSVCLRDKISFYSTNSVFYSHNSVVYSSISVFTQTNSVVYLNNSVFTQLMQF